MTPELGARVMAIAKGLQGSHYINGGYGAMPNHLNGCPCRPGGISLIVDPDRLNTTLNPTNKRANLAVYAATMTITTPKGERFCVCAGNYNRYPGGKLAQANDPDLVKFLDARRGKQVSKWPALENRLTPRRPYGPAVSGTDLGGRDIVWAESCEGKRHFDCVGFISYVYWQASGAVIQLEIAAWATASPGRQVFELAGTVPKFQDGDILVKYPHHIAFVGADGTIVQAQDTDIGVTISPGGYKKGDGWTHLVRLGGAGSTQYEWPYGWWRVYDGETYWYFIEPHGVAHYTLAAPFNTREPPDKRKIHNSGRWTRTWPDKLAITWNKIAGASAPCTETFWNATEDCTVMNATSTLYGPLAANRLN